MTDTPEDAERWARARFVARLIPERVDLRNLPSVAFALLNERLVYKDFWDVLDEAIVLAFGNRIEQLHDWDKKSMKLITKYVSYDGEEHDTEAECRAHERSQANFLLVGLTREQVEAAITRKDVVLADAIEEAGMKIARVRRDSGEPRRVRNREGKSQEPYIDQELEKKANLAALQAGILTPVEYAERICGDGLDSPFPEDAEIEQ